MKALYLIVLVAVSAVPLLAQDTSNSSWKDKQEYCAFIEEQAKADSLRLKTPSAVAGMTQPSSGTKPQMYGGVSGSLADLRRSGLVSEAGKRDCALYRATIDASQKVQYAWAAFEAEALRNRIGLLTSAIVDIDHMIAGAQRAVDAQDSTRMGLYALQSARQRLMLELGQAQTSLSAAYVPDDLPTGPMNLLVENKQREEVKNKNAVERVSRQDTWDLRWETGYHRQVSPQPVINNAPIAYPNGVYGDVTFTWNLARGRINKHLSAASEHYAAWKLAQGTDVYQNSLVVRDQMRKDIGVEDAKVTALRKQDASLEQQMLAVKEGDTPNARAFYNQMAGDELILRVDLKDSQFRLVRLKEVTNYNYSEHTNPTQEARISFTFDDGFQSAYQKALPILDKAGIKGTWYIVTKYLGSPSYMTADEVKALAADGQEIGSHTRTHKHLPTLSLAEQKDQITGSLADFAELGIKPSTLAYPFGEFNNDTVAITRDAGFLGARTVDSGRDGTDHFRMQGYSLKGTTFSGEVKDAIDRAQQNGTWLILVFHRVDEKSDNAINVTSSLLQEVVDYVQARHIKVVRVDDGLSPLPWKQ